MGIEIRDIVKYIEDISGEKFDTSLIGRKTDPFYKELYGGSFKLDYQIKYISDFAQNSNVQIFYELLQNASDAGATNFVVLFDENQFLAINNGEPFETDGDPDKKSRLRSFLTKNFGTKDDDPDSIGKHGQGSKLLYDLIIPEVTEDDIGETSKQERLINEIKNLKKGPILFSWGGFPNLQKLLMWDDELIATNENYKDSEIPLLIKIVYTYYPVAPNQRQESFFNYQELRKCVEFLNTFPDDFNWTDFNEGTLLYIPLGDGRYEKLKEALKGNLKAGLSTSLALLPKKLQNVKIREHNIQKPDSFEEVIIISKVVNDKKTLNTRLFIPENPDKLKSSLSNFYQYFPVTDEIHGLKFIIDSEEYTIKGSRQNIDISDSHNFQALSRISKAIIKHYESLADFNSIKDLVNLIKCILKTDKSKIGQKSEIKKLFYDDLIDNCLLEYLPTQNEHIINAEKIKINNSSLEFEPAVLGYDYFQWLNSDLVDVYPEFIDDLEIEEWNVVDILQNCTDSEKRRNWIINLSKSNYRLLLNDIANLNLAYSELKSLQFIRLSNKKIYSLEDFKNPECKIVLIESRTINIKEILSSKKVNVGGEELMEFEYFIEKAISKYVDDEMLFSKINKMLSGTFDEMTPPEKWRIFNNYKDNFNLDYGLIRNDLLLFKNIKESILPLSHLIEDPNKISVSGLLKKAQINPTEINFNSLNPYFLQENEIWNYVINKWDTLYESVAPEKYLNLLNELETYFVNSDLDSKPKLNGEIKWLLSYENNWFKNSDLFFNTRMLNLDESEYHILTNFVYKVSNLQMVSYHSLDRINTLKCAEINRSTYKYLAERFNENQYRIEKNEVEILKKTKGQEGFFTSFLLIKDEDENNLIKLKTNETQYFSEDPELNDFLNAKSEYTLLSKQFFSTFQDDSSLRREDDQFMNNLIEKYDANPSFIDAIKRRGYETKNRYLNEVHEVELSTEVNYDFKDRYEGKIIELIVELEREEEFKDKIYINRSKLRTFSYHPDLTLELPYKPGEVSYRLSDLLPDLLGESDVLGVIQSKLERVNTGRLFETKKYSPINVEQQLISSQSGITPVQLVFLISFYQTDEGKSSFRENQFYNLNLTEIEPLSLLNQLYLKKVRYFSGYLKEPFFVPSKHIYSKSKQHLLESEQIPKQVKDWINDDQSNRLKYLLKNGLEDNDGSILQIRGKILKSDYLDSNSINKGIKNKYLINNTFKWVKENNIEILFRNDCYNSISRITQFYFKEYKDLPNYLLAFTGTNHDKGKFELKQIDKNNPGFYFKSYNDSEADILNQGLPKLSSNVFDASTYWVNDSYRQKLNHRGVTELILERELIEDNSINQREWSANFYKIWVQEQDEYRIYICEDELFFKYSLLFNNNPAIDLGEFKTSGAELVEEDGINNIIIQSQNSSNEIIQILDDNKEELFKNDKDLLIRLLALSHSNPEKGALDELLENKNISEKTISKLIDNIGKDGIKLLNKSNLSLSEIKKRLDGEGGPDLGNLTDEEIENLKENIKQVNELLDKVTTDELKSILERLDDILRMFESEDKETTPNLLSGHIGEVLVVEWLRKIYSTSMVNINHASIVEDETGNFLEFTFEKYDIAIEEKSKILHYIDVKTNKNSLRKLGEAYPFFLSFREYQNIIKHNLDDYYIFRVSLEDMGLLGLYDAIPKKEDFSKLIKQYHPFIKQEILKHLEDPINVKRIEDYCYWFKFSVPVLSKSPFSI